MWTASAVRVAMETVSQLRLVKDLTALRLEGNKNPVSILFRWMILIIFQDITPSGSFKLRFYILFIVMLQKTKINIAVTDLNLLATYF